MKNVGGRPRTTPVTEYGARLESMFEAAGLTRTDVAARLGISYESVWGWLHTESRPSRANTFRLADLLGRTAEEVF